MDRSRISVKHFGVVALMCCMGAPLSALAAPPMSQRILPNSPSAGGEHREILARHLDLRAPATLESTVMPGYGESAGLSRLTRSAMRLEPVDGDEFHGAPAAGPRPARIAGNIEAFARRFRHEGLPVARLWENHAALVSLGLNAKGKPGLWLVQKTH